MSYDVGDHRFFDVGDGQPEDAGTDHARSLNALWAAMRRPGDHSEVSELIERCITHAQRADPCVLGDLADFATRKFVREIWSPGTEDDLARLFSVYVATGFVDVNHEIDGLDILAWTILQANEQMTEQLVLHGARTVDGDGTDLIDFCKRLYGHYTLSIYNEDDRAAAAARLVAAKMKRDISSGVAVGASDTARRATPSRRLGI
ncbi:hypothetical protein ABIC83_002739 [Roseateles asaccharophilus]|uniref:hypothetical protein n=1 Tax=Roseateles asaccharophilus TaxID=582607 RepID=UPI0038370405